MKPVTATPEMIKELSRKYGQTFTRLILYIYPPHEKIQKARLNVQYLGLMQAKENRIFPIARKPGSAIFSIDTSFCTFWNDIIKYNTAQVFDGNSHSAISKEIKESVKLTQILEGFIEYNYREINAIIGLLAHELEATQPPANFVNDADITEFEGE